MKIKKAQKKQMDQMKKEKGTYDLGELGVSLLWLFWYVYGCWDVYYYDWGIMKAKVGHLQCSL
jgi:hypothetical protein